jgi:hypothetical protein
VQRDDCTKKTEETLKGGKVHHYSWIGGGKEDRLQHYKVDELGTFGARRITSPLFRKVGHCWAETETNFSQTSVPQMPTVIKASEIVMKFFDAVS